MKMSKKERQAFIERSKDNISKYSIYSMQYSLHSICSIRLLREEE